MAICEIRCVMRDFLFTGKSGSFLCLFTKIKLFSFLRPNLLHYLHFKWTGHMTMYVMSTDM